MRKHLVSLLALLALPAAGTLPHPAAYEFDYGAKFTVSGYSGSALSGFPVLVRIKAGSPSGFSYDQLRSMSTGADLAFVDVDGNGLPFEIDTWDPSGTSLVWVKLPSMQNGTEFAMCWGSATSGKTVCNDNPFAGYVGVWHMSEASGTVADSSGHSLTASPAGAAAAAASVAVQGKVGNARQCATGANSTDCSYLSIPNYNSLSVGNTFAVSGWFWQSADQTSDVRLLSRKTDWQESGGWELICKYLTNNPRQSEISARGGASNKKVNYDLPGLWSASGWQHLTAVFNGTKASIYYNGVRVVGPSDVVAATDNGKTLSIGCYSGLESSFLMGSVDECRLLGAVPTEDWIAADYATQSSESFLTVGAAERFQESAEPSASVSVGTVLISSATVTVNIAGLGAGATSADVTVQVAADSAFASPVATESFSVSGETPIVRSVDVENLQPSTTYYARAVVANAGATFTTAVVPFTTARSGSSEKIVPGLEMYGALTLVDEIDCANDTTHRFRDYPAGESSVETILGVPTRVMAHKSDTCCYVSWRVGEGKGIVPNDPYVLVVDYPDDAPRSVTVFNFGNATRHGYHTGWTVGDSMSPPYVTQSLESWPIPYSGETRQLVQVMVPFEKSTQYNGGSRIPMATDGFDLNFGLIKADEAKDSVGLAVSAIRLYKIDSYEAARPAIPYPADGIPRRIVTSREEMGDGDDFAGFANPSDFYKGRAKMIRLLGMNTSSKDLLEFGYQQHWDAGSPERSGRWGYSYNYWPKIVDHLGAEDIYILPFYEYHGSRGSSGLGHNEEYKPWTLEAASYPDRKYLFSHQYYVYDCLADMTSTNTLGDLKELFDLTVVPYMNKANFLGMWLRNRGGMPLGFGPNAIARFNRERSKNISNTNLYNSGKYRGTDLYKEYRSWWYEKRRDLFSDLHDHMTNILDGARLYYSNTAEEPGEFWKNWSNPRPAILSNETGYTYQGKNFNQFTGLNWSTDFAAAASGYGPKALFDDGTTWGIYEGDHACPADDPANYTNLNHVALCYPFNCVWTVAGGYADQYRTAAGDLPFVRHYSLNENDFRSANNADICGYYTCDWDHAGRAVMLAELYAMAYADPTMLGYLFTANLVRNDSTYVREFNLEYLSLPALPSEVLRGGAWPATLTVRRWTTPAGTYWAVINCDSKPWSGQVDFQTSATTVWRTVDGTPLPLSGGKANLSLEPFQMRCFTGTEPAPVRTPVFRYAYAAGIAEKSATLVAELAGLGEDSTWVDVLWSLSAEDVAAAPFGAFERFYQASEKTARVSGLVPGTTYTVVMTATGSNGETSRRTFEFTTAPWPFALSEPKSVTDADGTLASLSIRVTRVDRAATLSLVADGETVKVWNDVSAGTAYSETIPLPMASIARYAFTISEAGTGDYPLTVDGWVLGRKTSRWIDARFDDSRYDSWPFTPSGVDPTMAGTWCASQSASVFSDKRGNRRIELETANDGYVRYVPDNPSPKGWKVRIEGHSKFVSMEGAPEPLDSAPLAALALGEVDDAIRLYGYTANGWVPFDGFRVPADGWIDWSADIDFADRTVTYAANEVRLSSDGVSALPVAGNQEKISRVTYVGMGEIDDFRGFFYEEEKLAEFDARIGTNRLTSLVFKTAGEHAGDFAIEVEDAIEGLWYAAFGSESLATPLRNWTCVDCRKARGPILELDAAAEDAQGHPITSQFFVLCGATEEIPVGTPLSDLLDNE